MEFKSHSDLTIEVWDSLISSFLKPGQGSGISDSTKSGSTVPSSDVKTFHKYAVATDDWRCSIIGREVLRYGGNAVDAAVASALCLGVVSSASSGIGGGAFMLIRLADGTAQALDMRESAPMFATKNMYNGDATKKAKGPLSIAVPGELAGLYKAWEKYGSKKILWESLVAPAAILADKGFEISDYLYSEMLIEKSGIFADKEGLKKIFTRNEELLQAGDICHNKNLAKTLRTISKDGIKPFYDGPIGQNLVEEIQRLGGIVNIMDLKSYEVQMREPISADILGMTMLGMPPPSAGGAGITLILNILAQYGVHLDMSNPLGIHRMIEAMKHFFAVRMNIGDPDYVDVSAVVSDMLSLKFAKDLKNAIDDNRTFGPDHYGGKWNDTHDYQKHEYGTSHLSVVDVHGNAVALTSSVNYHFGAQILSPSTGILLNNQMDDFCMPMRAENSQLSENCQLPENNNYIQGGKRPLSSMSPTIIVQNGKLKAVIGASGGTLIIPGVSEVILNLFVKKLQEKKSLMAPRLYHQLIPNVLHFENFTSVTGDHFEVPSDIREALKKKGHVLQSLDSGAVCQFITFKELLKGKIGSKEIMAASDPRKGGIPAGN